MEVPWAGAATRGMAAVLVLSSREAGRADRARVAQRAPMASTSLAAHEGAAPREGREGRKGGDAADAAAPQPQELARRDDVVPAARVVQGHAAPHPLQVQYWIDASQVPGEVRARVQGLQAILDERTGGAHGARQGMRRTMLQYLVWRQQ